MNQLLIFAIPALPLLAFLINGLFGKHLKETAGPVACAAMIGTAVCSILLWLQLAFGGAESFHATLAPWIHVGAFRVNWGFLVDPLSAVMLLVVSIVGSLVFVYAVGYMHGDPGFARFFTYLPLFAFSMYLLVLADNFVLLFVGWEGVGLCSYLLIGFWYKAMFSETMSNADAGRKAFIVNRIGDFGFMLGMFLVYWMFGSLVFSEALPKATELFGHAPESPWLIAVTLLLFVGATGKSAQIPLFIWLPDAMAGPTPVSALIHAATMVTAGVYMLARTSALFVLAPTTLAIVAVIGAATAFVAASIGLTQRDIKKVLAYSTVSQLGFMFLACGAGAFAAGIFHVFTHAFFKGCLFLCAGSVIHALHHEQDMFKMGGLKKFMPTTHWTYLVSTLAIAGVPFFSGFFSKDAILEHAFAKYYLDGDALFLLLWIVGMASAFMTAFYMFRSYYITFHGEPRFHAHDAGHGHGHGHGVHESPAVMTVPLMILAAGALLTGYVGMPFWPSINWFNNFLDPVMAHVHHGEHAHLSGGLVTLLTLLSVIVAAAGIALAHLTYGVGGYLGGAKRAKSLAPLYQLSFNKWWVDELYHAVIVALFLALSKLLLGTDKTVVDGVVNGTGSLSRTAGNLLRLLQHGRVQGYAVVMVVAAVLITVLLIVSQLPNAV